jgi:pentatricopeptide repeat protein
VLGSLRVAGQVDLVLQIFQELRLRGNLKGQAALKPDKFTCSCVVKALTGAGRPDLALKTFDTMRREGIRVDTVR